MSDPVNHPAHYTDHPSGVECIQITEHMGFNLGNAVKYIWRADLKGSATQDLEKARWYIDRELSKRAPAPAPAETEWPTWDAVPEGVKYTSNRTPWFLWENHGGTRYYTRASSANVPVKVSEASDREMQGRAPFVAVAA
ncbi:hypothetical protein ABH922_003046 [Rhodococcus sp. 27YEA15]|uniref:DUF3310 domain-containing protein n=1 Tax=Rhodococcus sp. 27YEA15 TaxID=3156259 RepID=UPI003C7CCF23